jgi:hypothetical protein
VVAAEIWLRAGFTILPMTTTYHATYVNHQSIGERASTLEELHELISEFALNRVLQVCSVVNTLLTAGKLQFDQKAHDSLVANAFPPATAQKLLSLGPNQGVVFHRQQILFLAKEAARFCPKEGKDASAPYWSGLGEAFLMANDHLHQPLPPPKTIEENLLQNIVFFIPILEAGSHNRFLNKMMRSHLMLTSFVEELRDKANFFDVRNLFAAATGLPLLTYEALIFGAMSRFLGLDISRYMANPSGFALPMTWFDKTAVPRKEISAFLRDVSASGEKLKMVISAQNPRANDMTILRANPLFRDGEFLFPLDYSFLAEKFESSPFWRVHNALGDEERKNFHAFWGIVFELYVSWLLGNSINSQVNEFHPSPHYDRKGGTQVCDALVLCGETAILIECKGSTFTGRSKYTNDPEELRKEIEKKLVGTDDERKGIRQLKNALVSVFRKNAPEKVKGVDLRRITKIMPVIVTRDDIGSYLNMNKYLNIRFRAVLGKEKKQIKATVTPVFLMSAGNLEDISPYLTDVPLSDVLEQRYRADPELRGGFWSVEIPSLKNLGPRRSLLVTRAVEDFRNSMFQTLGIKEPNKSC